MTTERSKKSIIFYTLLIPIFLAITLVVAILYWPQNTMRKSIKVTINHGESLSKISNKLMKSGVITNEKLFGFATKIMGLEKSIPVGSYQLENIKRELSDLQTHMLHGQQMAIDTSLTTYDYDNVNKSNADNNSFNYCA